MKSFVSIDRVEGKCVVCEVELISHKDSKPEDFAIKDTVMMDVPSWKFLSKVNEGDIFVVEHNSKKVIWVYGKDEDEKAKRLELLKSIMG